MSNDALRLINLNLKYQNFFAALIRWTKLVVSAWKKKYCPIASRCFCDKTSEVNTPCSITILHFCSYLIQIYLNGLVFLVSWDIDRCFIILNYLLNVLFPLQLLKKLCMPESKNTNHTNMAVRISNRCKFHFITSS